MDENPYVAPQEESDSLEAAKDRLNATKDRLKWSATVANVAAALVVLALTGLVGAALLAMQGCL